MQNKPHKMDPKNKLIAKRCKKLSGQALADELQKRRSKRYRALKRRWTPRLSLHQEITWRSFPSRERHETLFTFAMFAQLPTELRIKIWKFSFRGRTVEVCVDFDHLLGYNAELQADVPHGPTRIFACHKITQNPITLFVNHESLTETLKYCSNILPGVSDIPAYFNHQLDSFALQSFCSRYMFHESVLTNKLSLGITTLIGLSSLVRLRSVRSLTYLNCFIYDYRSRDRHRPTSQINVYDVFIGQLFTDFDALKEIIIMSGTPRKTSRVSGFDDPREVQRLKTCLCGAFEAEMESNPSFQTPEVTIYVKPFVLPIFRDEMQRASNSWVYENYDLKENADWFDSDY